MFHSTLFPRFHLYALAGLFVFILLILFWPAPTAPVVIQADIPGLNGSSVSIEHPVEIQQTLPATKHTDQVTVRNGDTLSSLFQQAGLSANTLYALISDADSEKLLRSLRPGEILEFEKNSSGELLSFSYIPSPLVTERFEFSHGSFSHRTLTRTPDTVTGYATGTIRSSLFKAAKDAGMSNALTMQLAYIFGWDVDFALDIREGDSFRVLYEDQVLDGQKMGQSRILAASFTNQGRTYEAVYFRDHSGRADYYSPDGRSMRKTFLRTPVDFTRISSHFSLGRKHPILNRIRNHHGTDYAAPSGTPIKAAGNGKVTFIGKKGGYGNVLILQHGQKYSTYYAHLRSFSRKLKRGSRVTQGEVIGYVGMTGLATGPHLHYEFRVNGKPVNPVTVKFPDAAPIDRQYFQAFRIQAAAELKKLRQLAPQLTAANRESDGE